MAASRYGLALVMLLGGALSLNFADEAKKADTKPKELDSKGAKHTAATTIDFATALGLPFASLTGLGARVEEARRDADPVGLANAAEYLAAAEKASGKKAPVTAEELWKEAVTMVKHRGQSTELKAVAAMVRHENVSKELMEEAAKAEKREQAEIQAFKAGEKPRGIGGTLTVRNNTQFQVYVYENNVLLGFVNPFRTFTFGPLGHGSPDFNSVLFGQSSDGSTTWGPQNVDSAVGNYTWTLNP